MEYKTIILTGGTGDIGQEITKALAIDDYILVVLSRKKRGEVFSNTGKQIHHISCDITDSREIKKTFMFITNNLPPLYGLVNCVGVNYIRRFENYSPNEIQSLISVNLVGTMLIIKETLPTLKKQNFGRVLNIASQAGIIPQEYNVVYSVAKAGILALTKGLAKECAPYNISINSICPGDIESKMMNEAFERLSEIKSLPSEIIHNEIISSIPCGRLGNPSEIAELAKNIFFLKTHFLTGSNIVVAGGRTCY